MKDVHKPVWRLNTGDGVPSDFGDTTYIPDSFMPIDNSQDYRKHDLWSIDGSLDIYIYETNRTKPAKYKRVECKRCHKSRFKGLVYCGGYFEYSKCPDCSGTGRIREAL